MRVVALISAVALVACASGNMPPSATSEHSADGLAPAADPRIAMPETMNPDELPFPADDVWRALPRAYDSLGIWLTLYDRRQRLIGNQGMQLRGKLGNTRLSKYIDCGDTQIGPSADSYEVNLSVITYVGVNSKGLATMTTRVASAARSLAFSQNYIRCRSNSEIEKRILQIVSARIATGRDP